LPVSYLVGTRRSVPSVQATGTWIWPPIPIAYWGWTEWSCMSTPLTCPRGEHTGNLNFLFRWNAGPEIAWLGTTDSQLQEITCKCVWSVQC